MVKILSHFFFGALSNRLSLGSEVGGRRGPPWRWNLVKKHCIFSCYLDSLTISKTMRCCPLSVLHYACARASSLHLLVKNIVFTYSREIERDCMLFIVLTCHWFHWTSGLINPCSLNDKRIVSELCSKSTEATLIFTKNSVNPVLWNMLTARNVKMRSRGPARM